MIMIITAFIVTIILTTLALASLAASASAAIALCNCTGSLTSFTCYMMMVMIVTMVVVMKIIMIIMMMTKSVFTSTRSTLTPQGSVASSKALCGELFSIGKMNMIKDHDDDFVNVMRFAW